MVMLSQLLFNLFFNPWYMLAALIGVVIGLFWDDDDHLKMG